ncbi:MAG: glycoside hydrolase family 38 C-terminal domain-containing protein [Verrucomicrobiota bacterium]
MMSPNPFPQTIPNRIKALLLRLDAQIWKGRTPLKVEATESTREPVRLAEAKCKKLSPVAPRSAWGRLFDQRWCRIRLPKFGDNTFLEWQDQGEATLYVNSQPYAGLDVAHRKVRLPKNAQEIWIASHCIQSAIWHPNATGVSQAGSVFDGAFLVERDEEIWNAFFDLEVLHHLFLDMFTRENPGKSNPEVPFGNEPMVTASPVQRQLLRGLEHAADVCDTEGPAAMRRYLKRLYADLRLDKTFLKCVLTGHAHIDLVWLWPERMGEMKAVHTFSTVDHLMDTYPEFRFAYSQPASYETVARNEPGLLKRVKRRVASGQWEATGAMYVESDTLLACGEALLRSFMAGQDSFDQMFGRRSRLTWLPDVFGYSACLPQMMQLTGVDYFFTTKMTWNGINRFPHSSFVWRGNDGSEVVTHVTQGIGYVTSMEVSQVQDSQRFHLQSDVHRESLLPTGFGDGGGGPTSEMCERARRMSSLVSLPEIEWDQPEAFFDRLAEVRAKLPVHQGECYLEFHRGTYTTHGHLKSAFRGLERALQVAEAAQCVSGKRRSLEHPWKRSIFAQFHDYIPGSSVWDVYAEGVPELRRLAAEEIKRTAESLPKGREECLFNPHPLPLRGWYCRGKSTKARYLELPPLSSTRFDHAVLADEPEPVVVEGRTVSNGTVSFRLGAKGWVERLAWEGVEVPLAGPLGQLTVHRDRAASFEAWDIDRHVLNLGVLADAKCVIEPFETCDHRGGLKVTRPVGKQSKVSILFYLESGSPLLHLEIDLDWREEESLLKLRVPTKYASAHTRCGIPYGSILRPQIGTDPKAEAMWEVPLSRYAAVYDDGESDGLFLATEAKYGAGIREGEIALSVVRSPRMTGFDHHGSVWPQSIVREHPGTPFSDLGRHHVKLALGRYSINLPRERQPAAVAETLFTPPLVYSGAELASPLRSLDGGPTLVPAWAMPLKDRQAFVLRFHEVAGQRGETAITAADGWKVAPCAADGQAEGEPKARLKVPFTPNQIKSVRFACE